MGQSLPCSECGSPLPAGGNRCERCGADAPSPTSVKPPAGAAGPLRVGDVLDGKWRLVGKLGSGGMGAVFLAEDVALGGQVAVKVLAQHLCHDPEFVTRFEREARTTARLSHPNVVPVYAVGRHGERPFLVMKALSGASLGKLLRKRLIEGTRLSLQEVGGIFRQLCAGLGHLHEKGYVHRDVKAANVFVGDDGHVTLLDLGILRDPGAARLTLTGALLGTPEYVAPEQFFQASAVDARADLYAAGVLLYECLALKPPFVGDPTTLMRLHASNTPPPSLAEAGAPGVPAAVEAVARKALAKKPEDRWASAFELWAALEEALGPAAPPGLPEPAGAPRPPAADLARTVPAQPLAGGAPPPGSDREHEPTLKAEIPAAVLAAARPPAAAAPSSSEAPARGSAAPSPPPAAAEPSPCAPAGAAAAPGSRPGSAVASAPAAPRPPAASRLPAPAVKAATARRGGSGASASPPGAAGGRGAPAPLSDRPAAAPQRRGHWALIAALVAVALLLAAGAGALYLWGPR